MTSNIGICRALNMLLDDTVDPEEYDAIVRWDNDCEVLTPNTLRDVAWAACETGWILAPRVNGLINPPPQASPRPIGVDRVVRETHVLGGIFMAIPADLFTDHEYRYDETFPPYTGDEAICGWWRARGGHCGYLQGYDVNHYERVIEQHDLLPDYQARKHAEMSVR
jgi:GT2 family glycosyltransferase